MTSARFGVGFSENAKSILLACRSSTELPYVDSMYSTLRLEDAGDVLGHLDAHARPGARGDVLVEIRRFAGQSGDAQHLGVLDPVDRRFRRLVLRPRSAGEDRRRTRRGRAPAANKRRDSMWSLPSWIL